MHVKKSSLYLVITSRYNVSPCMILELLERLTRCATCRCMILKVQGKGVPPSALRRCRRAAVRSLGSIVSAALTGAVIFVVPTAW